MQATEHTEPLETGVMKNKLESMKHNQLDQLELEEEVDASTKVSTTEVAEIKPIQEVVSHKDMKLTAKIREFERVLIKIPANIGDTALTTWTELGPFPLAKSLDSFKFLICENSKIISDLGYEGKPYQYIGQVDSLGKKDGFGRLTCNGGNIYEGQFKNDMLHGYGRFIYQNGGYFIGEYKNGVRCGSGLYVDEKGNRFDKFWVGN